MTTVVSLVIALVTAYIIVRALLTGRVKYGFFETDLESQPTQYWTVLSFALLAAAVALWVAAT